MKVQLTIRKIGMVLIAFCLMLGLSTCKQVDPNHSLATNEHSEIKIPSTDSHRAMLHELFTDPSVTHQGASYTGFRESPSAIYYEYDKFLYYADAGSSVFTILCGRPECNHTDEHCDAYIPYFDFTIFEGEIYTHDVSTRDGIHYIELWKRQLDGSTHEKVKDVYEFADSLRPKSAYFHQGYIYYPFMLGGSLPTNPDGTSRINPDHGLYRTPLDDKSPTELVFNVKIEELFAQDYIMVIQFYEHYLYIPDFINETQERLWRFDLNTGELIILVDPWSPWGYLYTDDTLYYYLPQDGFYEFDNKSSETVRMADDILKEKGITSTTDFGAFYTEQYIIFVELRYRYNPEVARVFVLNWDYELVNQFEIKSDDFDIIQPVYLATTSDYLFFVDEGKVRDVHTIDYAIAVDDLLNDEVEILKVETYR